MDIRKHGRAFCEFVRVLSSPISNCQTKFTSVPDDKMAS